jgi:hypothetical protein
MFFPKDPLVEIQNVASLNLGYLYARGLGFSTNTINVTSSGVLTVSEGFTNIAFSAGLNVTGVESDGGNLNRFQIYNRGNPVTLVNLSGSIAQFQRMILPSGANTVLGNNQWAEFFFDSSASCWRVML